MRPCRFCGAAIENRMKLCPGCGRDNTSPPPADETPFEPVNQAEKLPRFPSAEDEPSIFDNPELIMMICIMILIGIGLFVAVRLMGESVASGT